MNKIILLLCSILGLGYTCIYGSFMISFIVIIILNFNNNACNNVSIGIQYMNLMLLSEQIIFMIVLFVTIIIAYIRKRIGYYDMCIMITISQVFILGLCYILNYLYLYASYIDCFSEIKTIWIFSVIYMILTFIDGIVWLLLMILNKYMFKKRNEYIVIDGNTSYDSSELYSSINVGSD